MDKLQLTGQNLGRVFNFRFGHLHAEHFWCNQVKLPFLKLKTRPKHFLGYLRLVIALPNLFHRHERMDRLLIGTGVHLTLVLKKLTTFEYRLEL
jgi:hypothetical protein